jgi:hypothetical protein
MSFRNLALQCSFVSALLASSLLLKASSSWAAGLPEDPSPSHSLCQLSLTPVVPSLQDASVKNEQPNESPARQPTDAPAMLKHQGYPIRNDFPHELVRISKSGDYIFNRDSIAFRRWRLETEHSIPDSAFALNYLSTDNVYRAAQRVSRHSLPLQVLQRSKQAVRKDAAPSSPQAKLGPEVEAQSEASVEPAARETAAKTDEANSTYSALLERGRSLQKGLGGRAHVLPDHFERTQQHVRGRPIGFSFDRYSTKVVLFQDKTGGILPFLLSGADHDEFFFIAKKYDPELQHVFSGFMGLSWGMRSEGAVLEKIFFSDDLAEISFSAFPDDWGREEIMIHLVNRIFEVARKEVPHLIAADIKVFLDVDRQEYALERTGDPKSPEWKLPAARDDRSSSDPHSH